LAGIEFDEVWRARVQGELGGLTVEFIDRESYIKNKRVVARPKDLADVDSLSESTDESLG
jgi:hypothetical protein